MKLTMFLAFFSIGVVSKLSANNYFKLASLPKGGSVTLAQPASTKLEIGMRSILTANSKPQTIKFQLKGSLKGKHVNLAIFDSNNERVKYSTLNHGEIFLYSLNNLSSIAVVTNWGAKKPKNWKNSYIIVESDQPLSLAR